MRAISASELTNSLDAGSTKRLRGYMRSFSSDREKVIFDDRARDVVLKYALDRDAVLEEIDYLNHVVDDQGKPYSQSLREYAKLRDAAKAFEGPSYTSFRWNANYRKALETVREKFERLRLTPLEMSDSAAILENLPKVDTHSGWTYIQTGVRRKGEFGKETFAVCSQAEEAARNNGSFNCPILPGSRTQGSGVYKWDGSRTGTCKHKSRIVMMVALPVIVAELKYAKPLQKAMSGFWTYAGGKSAKEIARIIEVRRQTYPYWISADYSSFDSSISRWLLEDAFDILKSAFSYVDNVLWKIIVDDFIEKNIVLDGEVIHAEKGVPSGSMFTQIVDSVVNMILMETYATSKGIRMEMIVMGDDNLVFSQKAIDVEDLSMYVLHNFGMTINAGKTLTGTRTDHPEFLSREWTPVGQWRHPNQLLSRLLYPERFRDYTNQGATPEAVVYGYLLEYRLGMDGLIDVQEFMRKVGSSTEAAAEKLELRYLPGALRYAREYTMV